MSAVEKVDGIMALLVLILTKKTLFYDFIHSWTLALNGKLVATRYALASRRRYCEKLSLIFKTLYISFAVTWSDVRKLSKSAVAAAGDEGKPRLPPEISFVYAYTHNTRTTTFWLLLFYVYVWTTSCHPRCCSNEINMWCMFGCCLEMAVYAVSTDCSSALRGIGTHLIN